MSKRRHALVTGASGGLGRDIALRLAGDGLHVFVAGRNESRLDELAGECNGTTIAFDVTDPAAVRGAVERAEGLASGALDVVVNSAGVFDLAPIVETSDEIIDRNLAVNLRGTFYVLRAALPAMLEAAEGLIINVGSVSGRRAYRENGAYAASKFGLRGLHEVLLEELKGTGVRACLLEPGAVDTPIWDAIGPDDAADLPDRTSMMRSADVAAAVSYLVGLPPDVVVPLMQIEPA